MGSGGGCSVTVSDGIDTISKDELEEIASGNRPLPPSELEQMVADARAKNPLGQLVALRDLRTALGYRADNRSALDWVIKALSIQVHHLIGAKGGHLPFVSREDAQKIIDYIVARRVQA